MRFTPKLVAGRATARAAGLAICAAAALLGAGATTAQAQSLKSIRAQEAEERALDREVAFTNSVCGTVISASIDWRSAADWPDGASLAEACDGALGAVESICRSRDGKDRAGGLSSFVCAGDGAGPSLSGGRLRYGASPGVNGFSDTQRYLDHAL